MADPPHAMADPLHAMADPPSNRMKQFFTDKRKRNDIAYCSKKCQTSSAKEAVVVHAAADANHEVAAAGVCSN